MRQADYKDTYASDMPKQDVEGGGCTLFGSLTSESYLFLHYPDKWCHQYRVIGKISDGSPLLFETNDFGTAVDFVDQRLYQNH